MSQLRTLPWSRIGLGAIVLVALGFAITHVATIFSDRINWDEFLLLQRAEIAVKHGRIDGGGRPGLAVILLLPFVADCVDPVDAIVGARILWAFITFALIGGLFASIRLTLRGWSHANHAAALGTACVVLVPVFLRWSVQVRTDQPAIACALWGIVALLASAARPRLAGLGGALIGVGYLFSQKAIYVAGLGALLVFTTQFSEGHRLGKRDLLRVAEMMAGGLLVLLAYRALVGLFFVPPPATSIEGGLKVFDYYRTFLGYRVYTNMLPTVYSLIAALVLVVAATVVAYRKGSNERQRLLMSLSMASAGIAVGAFHAAAFPYFWMTLGLFFGAGIAVGAPGVVAAIGRAAIAAAVVIWSWLLYWSVPFALELLRETQAPQRTAFAFIDRNLPREALGFHPDGSLFCRDDPRPFPAFVRQNVLRRFYGPRAKPNIDAFVEEFRSRPVSFMITSGLEPFPPPIQEFWSTHYVPYSGPVALAGFRLMPEQEQSIDVIVPGLYRWHGTGELLAGSALVRPGDVISLPRGAMAVKSGASAPGILALAVPDPPSDVPARFHSIMHIGEIVGNRLW